MSDKEYYTFTELKQLGFSKTLINKHFPTPLLKDNPFYKCASPMKLYLKNEIDDFMETNEFQLHLAKREKRVIAAKKVAEKNRQETMNYIDKAILEIEVTRIDLTRLEELTIRHKEEWLYATRWDFYGLDYVPEDTLNRWMINYIRHELTAYDYTLFEIKGRVGKDNAYSKYRNAVMSKIEEVYPELFQDREKAVPKNDLNSINEA